jgi:hypothetical protein
MMDFDVERCTRHCAATGRPFAEGEEFYSCLVAEGAHVRRHDYAVEAWQGPPEGALGWWKSKMATQHAKKKRMAPSEVLLELFTGLESVADQQDMRYVLALLMVRRRVLRVEEAGANEPGAESGETLVLYCPRNEITYRVSVIVPDEARAAQIQDELARLLFADAA